jgi:glycosyltransferase involved in cell wall biosynthesis
MTLVSVIVPAYNRQKTLEKAVNSILEQTFQDLEVIIVDDASTDRTPEIADQLCQRDTRVRYLRHQQNGRAQMARNTGIKAAVGQWIAFLDSDDEWFGDSLEVRLDLAQSAQSQVVYSECYVLREGEPKTLFGIPPLSGNIYKQILRHPGPMFQSLLVTKAALEAIGFLDETILTYQEWETAIRLARHYEFAFLAAPTFMYDCRGSDTMSKNLLKDAQGYQQIIEKHFWEILKHLGLPGLAGHYRFLASRYQVAGHPKRAVQYRLSSLLSWPLQSSVIPNQLKRLFQT